VAAQAPGLERAATGPSEPRAGRGIHTQSRHGPRPPPLAHQARLLAAAAVLHATTEALRVAAALLRQLRVCAVVARRGLLLLVHLRPAARR
jgi:hypothetical protein